MKLSKDDLKEIVKECLVELLSEGLAGNKSLSESRATRNLPAQQTRQVMSPLSGRSTSAGAQQQRTSMYDKMSFMPQKEQVQKVASQKKINPLSMVKDLTSDPILAGVLAETASSGQYLNMGERERPTHDDQVMSGGDAAARMMLQADPTDMFGESANKWSTLAFADPIRK